jgi:hypothetical protein
VLHWIAVTVSAQLVAGFPRPYTGGAVRGRWQSAGMEVATLGRRAAPRVTWLGRILRGLRPDHNPLRRTADRVETAVIAGLLALFLAGAPLAGMAAAHWAYGNALRAERSQEAARHQIRAALLKNAPRQVVNAYGESGVTNVPAWWTAPNGARRTGEVTAAAGARAGSTVTIWTSYAGRQTGPPLRHSQVEDRAVLTGVGAVLAVAMVTLAGGVLTRRVIDRRRLAAWESEWNAAGPRWTSQR